MDPRTKRVLSMVRRELAIPLETLRLELEIDAVRAARVDPEGSLPAIDRDRLADVASGIRMALAEVDRLVGR